MREELSILVHPRQYGLQVYTDDDLRKHGQTFVGTNLYRGDWDDPAHVFRVEVIPEGILAHCRIWREGDHARDPNTGSEGIVCRSAVSGTLFVSFDGKDTSIDIGTVMVLKIPIYLKPVGLLEG